MPGSERCPATHSVETSTSGCAYATASSNQVKPDKDRKSTRLNSSHSQISYAVFCLKKKKRDNPTLTNRIAETIHIVRHPRYLAVHRSVSGTLTSDWRLLLNLSRLPCKHRCYYITR